MEPTIANKKPETTTNVGDKVLDLVIPYIRTLEDRNSVSLVSRKFCEIEGITRKRLTVHILYYPNPASLSKRFPFLEALTLKGPPFLDHVTGGHAIRITPWIEQLALEFRCLKELCIRGLVVHDDDLDKMATTRGKDLRSLKIYECQGFSTRGLMHVSKYCNQLRTLCLEYYEDIEAKDETWLHHLALNSTVLEMFHFRPTDISHTEGLTLLAKNCCNSLTSLKLGLCYLSKLGDVFKYAFRLEHFSGFNSDKASELVGFQFPPNMRSLSLEYWPLSLYSLLHPFSNQIRKLNLRGYSPSCQCSLLKMCPNLEVLHSHDHCGDRGMKVIGQFCKKLRKFTYHGLVTPVGLIALAKGCTKLECLEVSMGDNLNEAMKCLGTHMKNLRKLRMYAVKKTDGTTYLPLDNGIRDMLMGCSKLKRLDMDGGLTTVVGLEYIGKYGANLQSLSVTLIGMSDAAGFVKLSKGCPRLRMLTLDGCPFNRQAVVFNMPSLRYVCFGSCGGGISDRGSSNGWSSDGGSSDRGSSDGESSDAESDDRGSSDGENGDRESSDGESGDRGSSDGESSDADSDYRGSSDGESSDRGSSDGESSDADSDYRGSGDGESSDRGSSDGESSDRGSGDGESSDR